MLFLIIDSEGREKVWLVKANDSEDVEKKLKLTPSQHIVAAFTSSEEHVLSSCEFAVVTA